MWIINEIHYTTAVTILEKEEGLREIKSGKEQRKTRLAD